MKRSQKLLSKKCTICGVGYRTYMRLATTCRQCRDNAQELATEVVELGDMDCLPVSGGWGE